jgi:aryl-alcohol dehydrogenase-like predicted oxidoreductase
MEPRYWTGLGRTLSPMGFGCWQLAGRYEVDGTPHGWSDIRTADAVGLVHFALDRGIRFFDTAAGYGEGRSEDLLGQALASSAHGADAVVCTKVQLSCGDEAAGRAGPAIRVQVEQALRRLRRGHIDVLLLHNPSDEIDWGEFDRSVLEALRNSGKILTYGVSSRSLLGAERVLDARFGSCIEWSFNLLERRPTARLFPRLRDAGMNFIARSPLARGMIAHGGATDTPTIFRRDDFRSTLPQAWIQWAAASAGKLERLAKTGGLSQLGLRYCLSYPEVSAVIPGMHRRWQVEGLLAAAEAGVLEPDTIAGIAALTEECYPPWK